MATIDIDELMERLALKPEVPLRFFLDDISINQGYHVTEIKYARIKSLDCGKHTDTWNELLIQLLDGKADSVQGFMSTSKFAAIVSASLKTLENKSDPRLFFEFTPNNGPLLKLRIQTMNSKDNEMSIYLTHEVAACKPFKRWGFPGTVLEQFSVEHIKRSCCSGSAARD